MARKVRRPSKRKVKAIRKHAESIQRRMWKESAHLYGQDPNSPMPKIRHPKSADDQLFAGYYENPGGKRGTGTIMYPDWMAKRITGHAKKQDVYDARRLILHEWAHRFQNPKKTRSTVANEGGAEAFARRASPQVMKKLGWRFKQGYSDEYGKYAKRVVKKKGRRWTERDQFR